MYLTLSRSSLHSTPPKLGHVTEISGGISSRAKALAHVLQRKQKHCDRDADRNMEGLLRLGAGGLPGMGQVILMLRDMFYKIPKSLMV